MKRLRTVLFWCHLTAGISAGLVILIISVTRALLAFEAQIVDALERGVRYVRRLTFTHQREASVALAFGHEGTVYVNPYRLRSGAAKISGLPFYKEVAWA